MRIAAIGGGLAGLLFLASHWWLLLVVGAVLGWICRGYSERRQWARFRDRTEAEYGILRNGTFLNGGGSSRQDDVTYLDRRR